jgi:TRAP-type mannitol/chloroaromatic compound transport system permease small subunit
MLVGDRSGHFRVFSGEGLGAGKHRPEWRDKEIILPPTCVTPRPTCGAIRFAMRPALALIFAADPPTPQRSTAADRVLHRDADAETNGANRVRRNLVAPLLSLSRLIDRATDRIGHIFSWLVLATVLISAANAVVRKVFNYSSNGLLEIQWYLFSAMFLLLAGYTFLRNEHVRIDVIAGRLSKRAQMWIDVFGTLFFLLPMAVLLMWLSWPVFTESLRRGEISTNAGGLIIWPARLLVPIGFGLLALQGISELIKRIAFLQGLIPDPTDKHADKTAEEELAEEILRSRGERDIAEEFVHQAKDKP